MSSILAMVVSVPIGCVALFVAPIAAKKVETSTGSRILSSLTFGIAYVGICSGSVVLLYSVAYVLKLLVERS